MTGVILMSIKSRSAALIIAAVTIGSSFSAMPASLGGQITASADQYSVNTSKTPTAKSNYTSTEKDITISWDKVDGATGYYVYRWSKNAPAWVKVGTVSSVVSKFTDSKVIPGMTYKYYIVSYKKSGSKRIMSGRSNEISAMTKPGTPEIMYTGSDTNYISVYWSQIKCSGYEVYYKQGNGDWKLAGKITSADTCTFDIKGLQKETQYSVRVRAYASDGSDVTVYSEYSAAKDIRTAPDFLYRRSSEYLIERLDSAKLNPGQNTYEECDRQYDDEQKTTITVSDADIATIKKFIDAHKKDMTNGEFVDYTVQWLNKNVTYADGKDGRPEYSSIWNRSHVDNSFNYKVGQCVQYNSALCAVMRYLGYDARVVKGWRGNSLDNKWQHYWCEVTINGKNYVMDTFNYGTDGDWYYVCATYEETAPYSYNSHYIMNNKLMSPFKGYTNKR